MISSWQSGRVAKWQSGEMKRDAPEGASFFSVNSSGDAAAGIVGLIVVSFFSETTIPLVLDIDSGNC